MRRRPAPRWRRGGTAPLTAAVVFGALLAACGASGPGDVDGPTGDDAVSGTILVSAAASLTDAFGEIEAAFEAANPDSDVVLNLGGSATLREQILGGAPADVLATADRAAMAPLEDAGALAAAPAVFAHNAPRIAVPAGNPGGVTGLGDFADEQLLIGLCAEGVPCGELARRALERAGVAAAVDTNEPSVRALLTKIAAGELDAGMVYVTDVLAAGGEVEGIALPDDLTVMADYPIAPLADAPNPTGARAFVAFVRSTDGQAILRAHGFVVP